MEVAVKLSQDDLDYIIEGVTERLAQTKPKPNRRKVEPKALCAFDAAKYLGVSRPRFYELLKVDHALAEACITIGTKRLWPIIFLDEWLAQHRGKTIAPR
jgi:predicted DNA-binding transcriptional regulator AlpA